MNHVLVVDELKKVDYLEADVDRLNFSEKGCLALGLLVLTEAIT